MRRLWPKDWYAPPVVLWKLIWIIPTIMAKYVFLFFVMMLHGWWSYDFKDLRGRL